MFAYSISFLADCLLSEAARSPEYPHYTEESFRPKVGKAAARDLKIPPPKRDPGVEDLARREWASVLRGAKLTKRQREIVLRRLAGWTFEEIGRQYGHSKQGAQSIWSQARRKILRAHATDPWVGLAEVYRCEVKRGRISN